MQAEYTSRHPQVNGRCQPAADADERMGIVGLYPKIGRQAANGPTQYAVGRIDSFRTPQQCGEKSGYGQCEIARSHLVLESVPSHFLIGLDRCRNGNISSRTGFSAPG